MAAGHGATSAFPGDVTIASAAHAAAPPVPILAALRPSDEGDGGSHARFASELSELSAPADSAAREGKPAAATTPSRQLAETLFVQSKPSLQQLAVALPTPTATQQLTQTQQILTKPTIVIRPADVLRPAPPAGISNL